MARSKHDVKLSHSKTHEFFAGSGRVSLGFIGTMGTKVRKTIFSRAQYIENYTVIFSKSLERISKSRRRRRRHIGWFGSDAHVRHFL